MGCGLYKRSKSTNQLSSFTLIELLVVISVLALLMAIMFPAFRKVRVITKRTVCQSNLRQIAIAWHAYLEDNNGRFYQAVNANIFYGGWKGAIFSGLPEEYVPFRPLNSYLNLPGRIETEHGAGIFRCPADRGGVPGYAMREKAYRHLGTSYQTNIFLIAQDSYPPISEKTETLDTKISDLLENLSVNRVDNPSQLLLIGDYGWINQWRPAPHPSEEARKLAEWHGRDDYHNLAFLDGHVQFLNIRRGYYVTDEYTVIPFRTLYGLAREVQGME